ncbi:porin [Rubripirellula sp.]|nr:porin [Rubripirellula sp.]
MRINFVWRAAAWILLAGFQSALHADDESFCDLSACDDGCDSACFDRHGSICDLMCLGDSGGWELSGWLDAGIIGNTSSPASKFNGPYNAVDRSNELMMNQLYLVAEKSLPGCGHGIGGRVDYLYGEDFFLAESIGIEKRTDGSPHWNNEYYGSAFPQAFVSLGNQKLNVQVGHFYSIVGYEGVMAPDNFFYSKSYSYQFAGPFTHWGGQVNWAASDALTVQAGLHNGWDAFDRVSDKVGFIGKVRYDSHATGSWTSFAITTGEESNNGSGLALNPGFTNRTRYSWLVGLPLASRLDYVFHHWLGFQDGGAADGARADWYGIDQYLTYAVNRCTKVGVRFEWFRDEEGTRVGLNRASNPNIPALAGDYYSLSVGVNYTPSHHLTLRPEIRADWYDGDAAPLPFNDGSDSDQLMIGIDAILRI